MTQLTDKVPEIQFDIIARFIPGALGLAAYFGEKVAHLTGFVPVMVAVFAAYVVGFTLELLCIPLIDLLLNPLCKRYHKRYGRWPRPIGEIWAYRNTKAGPMSPVIFKMLAERSMFGSMFTLSVISLIVPPAFFQGRHLVSLTAAVAFALAFYFNSRWLSNIVYDDEELAKQSRSESQRK